MTKEMMEKAMECKSADEVLALAKENNIEMTEDEAAAFLESKKEASTELDDEELDAVSGGVTKSGFWHDYTVVTSCHSCEKYEDGTCTNEETGKLEFIKKDHPRYRNTWYIFSGKGQCGHCKYLHFLDATGVCELTRH